MDAWIVNRLRDKLAAYVDFNRRNPGYGGFLPWFLTVTIDSGRTTVNAHDNAQFCWTIVAVAQVLQEKGYSELASGYKQYIDLLAVNEMQIFLHDYGNGIASILIEANINDIKTAPR
jgi:hypothetical protein